MHKYFTLLLLACIALLGTGCFEILEEVDLNDDGSGRVKITANLSESSTNLSNYMKMGEVDGFKVPSKSKIEQDLAKLQKALAAAEGISNVQSSSNFEDFIFEVSADFEDVQLLNKAINSVADAMNPTPFEIVKLDNFDYTTRVFRRYFNYPVSLIEFDQLTTMQRYMLESSRIVSIYRFERPIRTFTNDAAQVSPNKRAIKMEQTISSILKGDQTIANSVIF